MSIEFIDSHCHFDFAPFSEHEVCYLERAKAVGVNLLIVPTINASNWSKVARLCLQHEACFYALGIHPLYLNEASTDLTGLNQRLDKRDPKCVAIGECGLDFWDESSNREYQIDIFREHCLLANQYQLPLIVHSRKSHDTVLKILRETKPKKGGVIHGFSGSLQQAEQFIQLGFYIGVGGVISYERAAKTRRVIAQLPLNKLVLETDAPDMPLSGYQGEANRPEMVAKVFEYLVFLRKESKEEIAETIYQTTLQLFNLNSV